MGGTAAQNVADGFDRMLNPEDVINNEALGQAAARPAVGSIAGVTWRNIVFPPIFTIRHWQIIDCHRKLAHRDAGGGSHPRHQILTLALAKDVEHRSPTTPRMKLVEIGAKVVHHGRHIPFRLADAKSTGEACLDDDKIARTGFRTRPNHKIWTVGWPRRKNCSGDREKLGSAVVDLTVIWEMPA